MINFDTVVMLVWWMVKENHDTLVAETVRMA